MPRLTSPKIKRRRLPSGATQFYVRLNGAFHALGADPELAKQLLDQLKARLGGSFYALGALVTDPKLVLAQLVLDRDAGRLRQHAPPYLVRDLVGDYLEHAERYYPRRGGTREAENIRHALMPQLVPMFGELPAANFGSVALARVRQAMIDALRREWRRPAEAEEPVRALARSTINGRVHRIRRAFRWAVENEKIPASVEHGLDALPALKRGRSEAREVEPVRPVAQAEIEATCAHLRPALRAMIWLQFWSGMRPGELLAMTGAQLDRSGAVWIYKPAEHKTNYLGRTRVVAIGPKAQEHLRPYLKLDPQARIFTPAQAEQERHTEQRAARRSNVTPSQQQRDERRQRKPKAVIGDAWDLHAYARAIARACKAAKVPTWSPNQLRHAAATRLRREVGLEAARVVLGHARAAVTEVYADLDHQAAAELMGRLG